MTEVYFGYCLVIHIKNNKIQRLEFGYIDTCIS